MNVIERLKVAPINSVENKTNIFAPVERINKLNRHNYILNSTVFEDDKLIITLSGIRLTQIHRDILDVILFSNNYNTSEIPELSNKLIKQFTLYEVLKRLNYKNKYNYAWLESKLNELKLAVIEVHYKNYNKSISFNIIRYKIQTKRENYLIIFESLYLKFFEISKISINYEPLLDDLLKINNPVTRAAIRYLLTFSKGINIKIDNLLNVIGVKGGERQLRTQRRKLIDDLNQYGSKFNITLLKSSKIGDVTVMYTRHHNVKIFHQSNKVAHK